MTKAVGYCRVSTKGQAVHGLGLEDQEAAVRAYCAHEGWDLVDVYSDTISGAFVDEDELRVPRPGFSRLLSEANGARGVSYVVVYDTSRLWRSDFARVLVQRDLRRLGLDIRSIKEPQYSLAASSEASNALINAVVEGIATYDRLSLVARLRRGRLSKAAQGGYACGEAPYGFRRVRGSKVLEIHEAEARIVRRIFALHKRGLATRAIARQLNGEGVKTKEGAAWRNVQVLRVLRRRAFYEGTTFAVWSVKEKITRPAILKVEAKQS